VLEPGSDDPRFAEHLIRLLQDGTAGQREGDGNGHGEGEGEVHWPALRELGYVSSVLDGEVWGRLHEACDGRGVELLAGFQKDLDFPLPLLYDLFVISRASVQSLSLLPAIYLP
jgi:hypothetical protein